jgi:ParB family chromosome partitioning protein
MNNAPLINQTSGDYEYYTPAEIVNAARLAMGSIDLDVASSARANETIKAARYFDESTNGLIQTWSGNIWMNHPFSRKNNPLWIDKLVMEYAAGRIRQACCITYACTSEQWFQPLIAFPQCFLSPRTNYYLPDGTQRAGVTKGSVVTYLGDWIEDFVVAFRNLGTIKVRW